MSDTSYHPETRSETGLYCFLSPERPCSAECMAYSSAVDERFKGQQFAHCIVLVGIRRGSQQADLLISLLKSSPVPKFGGQR